MKIIIFLLSIFNVIILNSTLASGGLEILIDNQFPNKVLGFSHYSPDLKIESKNFKPIEYIKKEKKLGPITIEGFNITQPIIFTPKTIFHGEINFFNRICSTIINHPNNALSSWETLPDDILAFLNFVRFNGNGTDVLLNNGDKPIRGLNYDLLQGNPVTIQIVKYRQRIGPLQQSGIF